MFWSLWKQHAPLDAQQVYFILGSHQRIGKVRREVWASSKGGTIWRRCTAGLSKDIGEEFLQQTDGDRHGDNDDGELDGEKDSDYNYVMTRQEEQNRLWPLFWVNIIQVSCLINIFKKIGKSWVYQDPPLLEL